MSRAQYNNNQPYPQGVSGSSPFAGTIVNGGLIDFQDNLQRGMQEYLTPSTMLAQQQLLAQQQQNGFQGGMPQQFMAASSPACICGPPSFYHVNGVTYKPVEDPNSKLATPPDAAKTPSPADLASTREPVQQHRILTQREVDDRVESKLKELFPQNGRAESQYVRRQKGAVNTANLSPEELAARRVYDLNAGMSAGKGRLQNRW
jgi:hypothetical protein